VWPFPGLWRRRGAGDLLLRGPLRHVYPAAYWTQQLAIFAPLFTAHQAIRLATGELAPAPRAALLALRRGFHDLLQRDLDNARRGLYPPSLLFQLPLASYLPRLPALAGEIGRTRRRARAGDFRDLPAEAADRQRYPDYYRRTFHWQTDGYLSERSAALYDLGVEFLFLGTADVMRRQIIPPISHHLAAAGRSSPGPQRLLDVACGTGRTLYQLHQAHPTLAYAGIDLSRHYVDRAEELLAHLPDLDLRSGNAEALPHRDGSFDVVSSVYLFHELPRAVRRRVLDEMRRTLRPGGLLVLADSAQLTDAPALAPFLERFAVDFHEPFYRDYLDDDLAALVAECGFQPVTSETHWLTRVVAARRAH
jgi:ubiquinone/menaquinone biosynthesis C-methylase UbiE